MKAVRDLAQLYPGTPEVSTSKRTPPQTPHLLGEGGPDPGTTGPLEGPAPAAGDLGEASARLGVEILKLCAEKEADEDGAAKLGT